MQGWRAAFTPSGLWRIVVPVVCLVAGLLFATSHEAARGHGAALASNGESRRSGAGGRASGATARPRPCGSCRPKPRSATDAAAAERHARRPAEGRGGAAPARGRAPGGVRPGSHRRARRRALGSGRPDGRPEPARRAPVRPAGGGQRAVGRRRRGDERCRPAAHRHQRGAVRRQHPAAQRPGVLAAVPDRGHRSGRRNVRPSWIAHRA